MQPLLHLVLFLVASGALGAAAVRVARALRLDTPAERVVATSMALSAAIVLVSLVLGAADRYRPAPVTVAAVLVSAAAWALTRRRVRGAPSVGMRDLVGAAVDRRHVVVSVLVCLASAAVAWRAVLAVLLPPTAFDAVAYHLPIVASWVRGGSLDTSDAIAATCCAYYPATGELLTGWTAVFAHGDRFVGLTQVAFLAIGAIATSIVARRVGASAGPARAAGAVYVFTPVALAQSSTGYVDVIMAGCVATALAMLLGVAGKRTAFRPGYVLVCALATGLALGVKATGIVYALLLATFLVVALVRCVRRRGGGLATASRPVAVLAGCTVVVLALGAGWYVRAWVATGNPLHPYSVTVAGHTVFDGELDAEDANPTPSRIAGRPAALQPVGSWLAALDVREEWRGSSDSDNARLGGLGLLWLLVGLPSLLIGVVVAVVRRNLGMLAVAAVVLVAVAASPDPWYPRFTIPLVVPGLAAFGWLATVAGRRLFLPVAALCLPLALVSVALTKPLAGVAEVRTASGAPIARPTSARMLTGYAALDELPRRTSVLVEPGDFAIPYLAVGAHFTRAVRELDVSRAGTAATLCEQLHDDGPYLVTRTGTRVAQVARTAPCVRRVGSSARAVVYRVASTSE